MTNSINNKMFRFYIYVLLFFGSVCTSPYFELQASPKNGKPVFSVSNNRIDLGRLAPEEKKRFNIHIENTGNKTLIIHSVSANCGCLSSAKKWKDVSLNPGESRDVDFYLFADAKSGGGILRKIIAFKTNDPIKPVNTVAVFYTVKRIYTTISIPSKLDLGTVKQGETKVCDLVLVSPFPKALKIDSITISDPLIIVNSEKSQKKNIFNFKVEIPGEMKEGIISESIKFETSLGVIVVLVQGRKEGSLEVTPGDIVLMPMRKGEEEIKNLRVLSSSGSAFRITNIACESENIQLEAEYGDLSRPCHIIKMKFKKGQANRGIGQTNILIETDEFERKILACKYYIVQ